MNIKSSQFPSITFSLFLLFSVIFSHHFSVADQLIHNNTNPKISIHSLVTSAVYPLKGNVYPLGYYSVSINIGNPPRPYELDIDTGSDFTWVQCDAPCIGCTRPKDQQYQPKGKVVKCSDPLCAAVPNHRPCSDDPNEQCDYDVKYADNGQSLGVLVRDNIPIGSTRGPVNPSVGFGCGYDQEYAGRTPPPDTIGVLGLGYGKTSIVSQLSSQGLIRNVLGHCISSQGGYLFLGEKFVPSSGIVWTPIIQSPNGHYNVGPADMFFNGKPTSVKDLQLIFDSGSSYTYFNSKVYGVVLNMVTNDLKGKPLSKATEDKSLPICWKGGKPFKSLNDVKSYFKPLTLSFTKSKNAQFQLPPEAYLIITKYGNVCLGILDGTEVSLGNLNLIGDISMVDKVMVYDNEKKQIGWASANCNQRPH